MQARGISTLTARSEHLRLHLFLIIWHFPVGESPQQDAQLSLQLSCCDCLQRGSRLDFPFRLGLYSINSLTCILSYPIPFDDSLLDMLCNLRVVSSKFQVVSSYSAFGCILLSVEVLRRATHVECQRGSCWNSFPSGSLVNVHLCSFLASKVPHEYRYLCETSGEQITPNNNSLSSGCLLLSMG